MFKSVLSKKSFVFFLFIFFFLFVLCNISFAFGVVIDDTNDEGIKGNLDNDFINLTQGTYSGANNTNISITNDKNIIIQSHNPNNKATIDCEGKSWFITNTGNLTLINLIITNSYRNSEKGGAIHNTGKLTIINCTFIDNINYNGNGSAIYNEGNAIINESRFLNNLATCDFMRVVDNEGCGGAIYNKGNMNITNSNFENNSVNNAGGSIFNSGLINIFDSYFKNNTVTYGDNDRLGNGGAIYGDNGNINIKNSNFISNIANNLGGAIDTSGFLEVTNSNFSNNIAITASGGAICNILGNSIIISSNFINNTAVNEGGAIMVRFGDLTVFNSNFINNTIKPNDYNHSDGGAICISNGNLSISNSYFINNTAKRGGAICNFFNSNANIVSSTFLNNIARHENYGYGGAIYSDDGNLSVINSQFENNIAYRGTYNSFGGAICSLRNADIKNTTFLNNNATQGGAIYNGREYTINISDSYFVNNVANFGGAIYNDGNLILQRNIMLNNIALSRGAMIYNNGQMDVLNLTYLNNKTIRVDNNTYITLFAFLTDDMGNTITNQNISFFVDSAFIGNGSALEGYANITYLVTHGYGIVTVTGDYAGHESFNIIIRNAQLLITNDTIIENNINFDKEEYFINQTANLKINLTNNGLEKAYNITVKINLPPEFILNKNSIIVSHGHYDSNTNTWFIGDLEIGEEASMTFSGHFTKTGNYTATIITNGLNFNTTTDFDTTIVKQNKTPVPKPVINGNINFDKEKYFINQTANLKINITNNGLDKAYNVTVKINLPKNFVLNKNSVVVSHGYFDSNTNVWFVGDLEIGEEVLMTFSGYFTKTGHYTVDIVINGLNFNTTTDFDTTIVKQNKTPINNKTNKTNNNPINKTTTMKPTGIPVIAVILVLLSSLGLVVRKR